MKKNIQKISSIFSPPVPDYIGKELPPFFNDIINNTERRDMKKMIVKFYHGNIPISYENLENKITEYILRAEVFIDGESYSIVCRDFSHAFILKVLSKEYNRSQKSVVRDDGRETKVDSRQKMTTE